jgi:hypothetical protein
MVNNSFEKQRKTARIREKRQKSPLLAPKTAQNGETFHHF